MRETKEEKRIFNDYLKEKPKPTAKTWTELAALYKGEVNYDTVFLKLPTTLASHCSKGKQTQELVLIKDSISQEYYDFLKQLGVPVEPCRTNHGSESCPNMAP